MSREDYAAIMMFLNKAREIHAEAIVRKVPGQPTEYHESMIIACDDLIQFALDELLDTEEGI